MYCVLENGCIGTEIDAYFDHVLHIQCPTKEQTVDVGDDCLLSGQGWNLDGIKCITVVEIRLGNAKVGGRHTTLPVVKPCIKFHGSENTKAPSLASNHYIILHRLYL